VSTVAVVVAAVLGIVAVVFVARPFLRDASTSGDPDVGPVSAEQLERLRAAEDRDRALAALKELEFDHRTGKISDTDYRELIGPLRREAAEALRALDRPADVAVRPTAKVVGAGGDPGQEAGG